MRKISLLIMAFISLSALFSCTYDYFEDETNYQLYVAEVANRTVSDCRVLVYNEAGELVGNRYVTAPWEDPRMSLGRFTFKLLPGKYRVFCYTNTDSISFTDEHNLQSSAFFLKGSAAGANHYAQPPRELTFHKSMPTIVHPNIIVFDTARVKPYTGRITVRFKNFPHDVSTIKTVQLSAENAATVQYLKNDTLTSRFTSEDRMYYKGPLTSVTVPGQMETDHTFFPTMVDEQGNIERITLHYTFYDASGNQVVHLPIEVAEKEVLVPLRLLHGRRIIIEVDKYLVSKIVLVGWDEDIQSGDTNLE